MTRRVVQRDVKVGGVRLRVGLSGSGPPLVVLHDLFLDGTSWDGVADELADEFRIVAPDLPGFGESEKPAPGRYDYGVSVFADSIAGLFAGLGIGRAAIAGHGLGGAIAITLAALHPELASKLILINPLCYEQRLDLPRRAALVPVVGSLLFKQLWGRAAFRTYFREQLVAARAPIPTSRIDHYYDGFSGPAARSSALATLRATVDTRTVEAKVQSVQAASLVVWGRHDGLAPAAYGQRLAKELRGGFELMDAGHSPQEERPRETAEVIARFLRDERPSKF